MIKMFINRPVLSTVISIIIVILGVLGIVSLPVTQYPNIAPPTVMVSASYTGANAETVMKSVIIPLEEQINGVEGMDYISSTATNSGSASINVVFKQGVDPDIATVNVQNRVNRASSLLPSEVTRTGVTTQKQQTSSLAYLAFYSENPDYDDVFINNYLNISIVPALKRINGIGDVNIFGGKNYSMRIWLDPEKMANYGLMPSDITAALAEQSLEAAAGQLGQNNGNAFEYIIRYKGKFNEKQQYDDIIIKAIGNGQYLRLKDVAKVELAALSYITEGQKGDYPSVAFAINQTPGSNAQEILTNVKAYLKENEKSMPKGIKYVFNMDTSEFLSASISSVISTLIEAFILVFLVVYIFLQDLRSTLIPAIAVPVSIVGTFVFLNLLGYSINLLTLFALVLAIGIVVDDAIVVVEAVHAKLERGAKSTKIAAEEAMSEITTSLISITLVMGAIFIPVSFISGPTGVFYQQFGLTMVISIFISAVNALTLSPMLCALLLKVHNNEEHNKKGFLGRFFEKFNIAFEAITVRYIKVVEVFVKKKWLVVAVFAISGGIFYWANSTMKSGFVPTEDRGFLMMNIELAPGASMERTFNLAKEVQKRVKGLEGVEDVTIVAGNNIMSGAGSNNALGFILLKPFEERTKNKGQSAEEITKKLFGLVSDVTEAKVIFFQPPSIPGYGTSSGISFELLDKEGGDSETLAKNTQQFLGELMKRPEIQYAQTSFNTNYPQYEMIINVAKAKESGITVSSIINTMQGYIGGIYAADFTKYGKQFRVMVQALPNNRNSVEDLSKMYVRTSTGAMAPVSQFVSLERVYGPQSLKRHNLYSSASVSGANAVGYSTGDAMNAVREVAAQTLPSGYGIDFTGLSREEANASSQTVMIFGLSLLFVYFFLSAQYESYILPLVIIFSLPIGIMGAFLGQNLAGLENNIYFQIALIMLVGLLAKNAILIVEFAVQRRMRGDSIVQAALLASKDRLRPILMTSFAFILGLVPLIISTGIGYIGNRSIATGAAAGLLIGTFVGLLVVPVLFVVFQYLQEKVKPIKFENKEEL